MRLMDFERELLLINRWTVVTVLAANVMCDLRLRRTFHLLSLGKHLFDFLSSCCLHCFLPCSRDCYDSGLATVVFDLWMHALP